MTQVGGKSDRRRMQKKRSKSCFMDGILDDLFGAGSTARYMRDWGYWKSTGPRKPLWRKK